jgi:hypothetical protein
MLGVDQVRFVHVGFEKKSEVCTLVMLQLQVL